MVVQYSTERGNTRKQISCSKISLQIQANRRSTIAARNRINTAAARIKYFLFLSFSRSSSTFGVENEKENEEDLWLRVCRAAPYRRWSQRAREKSASTEPLCSPRRL